MFGSHEEQVTELQARIAGDTSDPGYDDPLLNRLSHVLVHGWRYEDDWYSPERLLVLIEAAGFHAPQD